MPFAYVFVCFWFVLYYVSDKNNDPNLQAKFGVNIQNNQNVKITELHQLLWSHNFDRLPCYLGVVGIIKIVSLGKNKL